MRFHTTEELAGELTRLRLVTPEQLAEAQASCDVTSDPESLIKALEQKHLLTNYQASKLRSDERGPLVLGGCKLLYQNASGSFARVYRGASLKDGSMVGFKVLRQRFADDPTAVAHFHREAELCRKLRHKNIVPIYDVGDDDGFHYFTMEFVEGGNLRDIANIRGKLQPVELLRCGCDMAEGLEYALTQGMTHRDFKLTNVLMSSRGVAKLVDFGLAGDESSSRDDNVQAVEYATLEKNTRAPKGDPRSDLFFLGAVLYELATGIPPWPPTKSLEERKQFQRYSGVRPIRNVDPGLPPAIIDIIDRLMRINPYERYQSATEAVRDIKAALAAMGAAPSSQEASGLPKLSTVMCVENRPKQQDMLREYLTKHGYRVLMLSTPERALNRLKTNPPECLLVMGEALDGHLEQDCGDLVLWSEMQSVPCVLVLPQRDAELARKLPRKSFTKSLLQPVTLRDLRTTIADVMQACANRE